MKKQIGIRFWYFGELFILLHLAGMLHCSWWWAMLFYFVDAVEYLSFLSEKKTNDKVG